MKKHSVKLALISVLLLISSSSFAGTLSKAQLRKNCEGGSRIIIILALGRDNGTDEVSMLRNVARLERSGKIDERVGTAVRTSIHLIFGAWANYTPNQIGDAALQLCEQANNVEE